MEASVATETRRKKITDVRVLAALAHPTRLSILRLLLTVGDRTATQCAEVVGESPSSCSYHLRHLARFGLVERVEAGRDEKVDGRTRGWRSVATGFDFGELDKTGPPELVAATGALISLGIEENVKLSRHYLSHTDEVPEAWQSASCFSNYALLVNVDELRKVVDAINAIVRPLRGVVRHDAPADALQVHLLLEAFPRTDLL
jgi:DNA-binding transcriptional ArsR family regulator